MIPLVHETKFLGIWLDDGLTWVSHLNKVSAKIKRNVHLLRNHRNGIGLLYTQTHLSGANTKSH